MTALATADQVRRLLHYSPSSGYLTWLADRRGGAKAGALAGTRTKSGYIQVRVAGRLYMAHRLAWLITHGSWPTMVIDHIDGDGTNNRLSNLRDVSFRGNQENQRRAHRSNRSSGLLGAHFDARTNRWLAKISVSNRTVNLGRFDTAEEANAAYLSAKRTVHAGAMI